MPTLKSKEAGVSALAALQIVGRLTILENAERPLYVPIRKACKHREAISVIKYIV
jgi:hypothetical protein